MAFALLLAGCTPGPDYASEGATSSGEATVSPGSAGAGTARPTITPEPLLSPAVAAVTAPGPSPSTPPPTAITSPSTPSTPPTPTATPTQDAEPVLLRAGDKGDAVAQVQRRLRELGYFLPTVDGDFGSSTLQAVWALQKAAGITRDGVVGPETLAALDAGARPTPRSTTGHVIEVDLVTQLVLAVQDGHVDAIINASSGSGRQYEALGRTHTAFTPRGDFTVIQQVDGMHDSTLGLGTMYRPKYFRGGWAIHGSPSIPPYPASHGCVRVSNAAINWIWDDFGAPLGTPVLIYRG